MSTIRETVTSNLRSDYVAYGNGAIEALEAREQTICDGLRAFANEKGLGDREVDNLFVTVGLMQPAPVEQATIDEVDGSDPLARLESLVTTLATRVESLVTAAARHGVHV